MQEALQSVKMNWIGLAACTLLLAGVAQAAPPKRKRAPARPTNAAEVSLIGIRLFDTGVRVVTVYGSPDAIEAVNVSSGGNANGGGGTSPDGSRGGGAPQVGGGGAASGSATNQVTIPLSRPDGPFNFGDQLIRQFGPPGGDDDLGLGRPGGGGQGRTGGPNGPNGSGASGGGGAAGGTGNTERTMFTRWIYNRNGSKYAFVLDKFNRVIQIEAIGINNSRVRTSRGVTFGDTFAKLIKTYGAPDGYEIGGNNVTVRYHSRRKVAFRLNRIKPDKPHVVTAIVVAAGK